jgi:hypothetical protein
MKQIAGLLNLSQKTVEFHKHHVMEAFNLRSNAANGHICPEAWIDFAKALAALREYRHRSGVSLSWSLRQERADRHKAAVVEAVHSHPDTRLLLIGDSIINNYDGSA